MVELELREQALLIQELISALANYLLILLTTYLFLLEAPRLGFYSKSLMVVVLIMLPISEIMLIFDFKISKNSGSLTSSSNNDQESMEEVPLASILRILLDLPFNTNEELKILM